MRSYHTKVTKYDNPHVELLVPSPRRKQYRDPKLQARNLQPTHTIANILAVTELSPPQ
jgi:hypothetical protein